jgi:hypothetical protein
MIHCKKYNATIPEQTCIARLEGLKKASTVKNGWLKASALDYAGCANCEIGQELYNNRNKGKVMETKVEPKMKTCTKCDKSKPADKKHFYRDKNSPDGLHAWCKDCHNKSCGKTPKAKKKTVVEPDSAPVKSEVPQTKEKIVQEKPETFYCPDCGKAKELTRENFFVASNTRTGFETKCKICSNKIRNQKRGNTKHTMVLDFTDFPELHGKIKEWAADNMRDPHKQIVWNLKEKLLKAG